LTHQKKTLTVPSDRGKSADRYMLVKEFEMEDSCFRNNKQTHLAGDHSNFAAVIPVQAVIRLCCAQPLFSNSRC
jgi:hypothetical protein